MIARLRRARRGGGLDSEDGMVGTDAAQVVVRRVGTDAAEEDADLGLPAFEVGAQGGRLLVVGELCRSERLRVPADAQLPSSRRPHVAHPVRLTASRDEVAIPFVRQEIDGRRSPLAALAAAHAQLARPPDAETGPSEHGDDPVEDVLREPARAYVAGLGCGHRTDAPTRCSCGLTPRTRLKAVLSAKGLP